MKTYEETCIDNAIVNAMINKGFYWNKCYGKDMVKSIFDAISKYLIDIGKKYHVRGIDVKDRNFFFAAFIKYTGNDYNITYTFNADDIKYDFDITNTSINKRFLMHLINSSAANNVEFTSIIFSGGADIITTIILEYLRAIKDYLDDNSLELKDFLDMINKDDVVM
jgi:hypothetical protein